MKYSLILLLFLAISSIAGVAFNSYDRELANIEFDLWEYNTKEEALEAIEPALEQFAEQVCASYIIKSIEEDDSGYIITLQVRRQTYELYYNDAEGDESKNYDKYTSNK